MKNFIIALLFTCLTGILTAGTKVELDTSKGKIVIELNDEKAPKTVKNFLKYVDDKHYDGVVFHRVIKGFMIQGGGFAKNDDGEFEKKETEDTVDNEADNGLSNERGTIAMARTSDPHSASAQFFINHKDNRGLDHTEKTLEGWGYCVFGKVIEGMDVVDAIAEVSTTRNFVKNQPMGDWPTVDVVIKSVKRVEEKKAE